MSNKVHLTDNMEFMKTVPDNYYELAIVDPPYGINQGGGKNKTRSKLAVAKDYKDYGDKTPDKIYFDELIRISKNQIIWGANHFISKIPFDSSCWIVWDKNNGKNDFADCELAYTSFNTSVRIFKFTWNGMLQGDMKNKEVRIHPNQKPVALYKWILNKYAKNGDKIFDSHVGSASSRIACYDLGYEFEGCEIDKYYWQLQEDRFNKHISQLSLFTPDELDPVFNQVDLF